MWTSNLALYNLHLRYLSLDEQEKSAKSESFYEEIEVRGLPAEKLPQREWRLTDDFYTAWFTKTCPYVRYVMKTTTANPSNIAIFSTDPGSSKPRNVVAKINENRKERLKLYVITQMRLRLRKWITFFFFYLRIIVKFFDVQTWRNHRRISSRTGNYQRCK